MNYKVFFSGYFRCKASKSEHFAKLREGMQTRIRHRVYLFLTDIQTLNTCYFKMFLILTNMADAG